MSKSLKLDELRSLLETGDFDKLIGAVECEWLECKLAPYQVKEDLQKQELAKDVSGLANADGGMILIGIRTERNPTHFGDEIKEVRAFPRTLVDLNQYHDILQSWVYPPLQQVDIRWLPSSVNNEKGIVAISIPNQMTAQRPFLVTKSIDETGKRVEVVFGYVERRRENATPISVQELHALIKNGLLFDSLNRQYNSIQEALQQLLTEQSREKNFSLEQDIQELLRDRRNEALTEAKLLTGPIFVLAAIPVEEVEIPALFQSKSADLVRLLENPPELRSDGFDLNTGESPKIIKGQLRRTVSPEYKILDLWRDGTLIFAARGDEEFLCWGKRSRSRGPLRINPLVLSESTYLFAELSRQVFDRAQPNPREIEYRLELLNMTQDGAPCGLIPAALGTFAWEFGTDIRHAPDSHVTITGRATDLNPGAVAFDLIAELYAWFGIEQDQIPYTERLNGGLVISPDLIKKAGG